MEMNEAQKLLAALGVPVAGQPKQAHGDKNAKATKRGPGRFSVSGTPGNRITKQRPIRAYRALMAAWAAKRVPFFHGPRDEHGAYTVVGNARRKWLAGISAQRGY